MFKILNTDFIIINYLVLKSDEEINIFIAETVRTHRENAGISQRELARRIGISNGHLSMIEGSAGYSKAHSFNTIAKIIDYLKIDIKQFWRGVQESISTK